MGLKYNWIYPQYNEQFLADITTNYNIVPTVGKILNARGVDNIEDAKKYLSSDYEEGYDPFLMYDMQKAVDRIHNAIENEEKILVYGDYDADGITSTVLLVETLISLGADVSSYIPNRFDEGYGPNKKAFEKIINSGISLIITVDNGIAGIEEVDFANSLGCDVIITDHHKVQDTLPNAYAIIHPEHPKGQYPFGKLAGVGVAFKLAHALLEIYPDFLLDLVAIGTVADMVPLIDENRIFVKQGIELINEDTRIGLKMLMDLSNIELPINEQTIGFYIAPKLNSIGRMDSAKIGLSFLMADDPYDAKILAEQIENYNIERKAITEKLVNDIVSKVENSDKKNKNVIVVYGEDYHEGVLGIIASNITDKYHKPALIINKTGDKLKGSARSVYEFNIYEAMNSVGHLFSAYGGHTLAAGFSLDYENIDEVEQALDEKFLEYKNNNDLKSSKNIDIVTNLEEVSYQFLNTFEILKPFGMSFNQPHILLENVRVDNVVKFGSDKQYLRIVIADEISSLECITFKDSDLFSEVKIGDTIDMLCTIEKNKFNGRTKLQAHIVDLQIKQFLFEDYRTTNISLEKINNDCLKLSKTIEDSNNNFYKYKDIEKIDKTYDNVYLLDVPNSKEQVDSILKLKPNKIYVICKENKIMSEHYKIDKQRLITFFNLLVKSQSKQININSSLASLVKTLATNVDSIKIMIQIFQELNLVTFNNNIIKLNENFETVDLKKSASFVTMENLFEMENIFLKEDIVAINKKFGK